jgi:glycosyltransferase involved in cell wall biosynthesis
MRVIHVIPGITEEASGPSYSVVRLCESLIDLGNDVTLAAMNLAPNSSGPAFAKLFPIGVGPRRLGRAPEMCHWLKSAVARGTTDLLHSHGMWQMNSVYPGWAVRKRTAPLMVSPRGSFSRWAMAHGAASKRVFWPLLQRPALSHASCFHSTSRAEYDDIRRLGFQQPVAYIPNAVDVPVLPPKSARRMRTLLFLGRIHPVKGVDTLLHAWSQLLKRHQEWRLQIVGTDTAYQKRSRYLDDMRRLSASLGLTRVDFVPPAYGQAKWDSYHGADLFVLPTRSESFGMTVAESLASGTPVVVTTAAPWERIEAHESGWWIETGVEPLVAALDAAMCQSPGELTRRGQNGRRWMQAEFSWRSTAVKMHRTYAWLTGNGEPPPWVTVN